jgi:hypothetical protein
VWLAPNSQALARYTVDRVAAISAALARSCVRSRRNARGRDQGLDRVSTFLYYQLLMTRPYLLAMACGMLAATAIVAALVG